MVPMQLVNNNGNNSVVRTCILYPHATKNTEGTGKGKRSLRHGGSLDHTAHTLAKAWDALSSPSEPSRPKTNFVGGLGDRESANVTLSAVECLLP